MRGHLRMISRPYYYNCMHMTICLTASFSQCRIKKTMRIMKRTFFSIWWNTSKARQFCHHHCAAWHQQLQSLSKCVQRKKKSPKARQLCHHICAAWLQQQHLSLENVFKGRKSLQKKTGNFVIIFVQHGINHYKVYRKCVQGKK